MPDFTDSEIDIQKLSEESSVSGFSCYERELVDFLKEDALVNQNAGVSTTYLFLEKTTKTLLGYITLLTDAVHLDQDLKEYFRKQSIDYKSLPALKIGRIPVDDNYQRRGIGTRMVDFSIVVARKISSDVGCRFITLDAKKNQDISKSSVHFYKKMGFSVLKERAKGTTPMYFDLWLKA